MSLEGKTILVTGASSGIGHALTTLLLKNGARVLGLCRDISKLPQGTEPIQCDLADTAEINSTFDAIPHLDAIINNAGLALLSGISDGDPADWETMWRINVHALTLCRQKALPLLPDDGQIINVSSMSGHRVPSTGGFYAPTKFAVRAVTDALRAELRSQGKKNRVATVSPGFVDTPLLNHYFKGREDALEQTKASMRMLTAEDIAHSILQILNTPPQVEITDIQLRSSDQVG